jgi:hypothetical protein
VSRGSAKLLNLHCASAISRRGGILIGSPTLAIPFPVDHGYNLQREGGCDQSGSGERPWTTLGQVQSSYGTP